MYEHSIGNRRKGHNLQFTKYLKCATHPGLKYPSWQLVWRAHKACVCYDTDTELATSVPYIDFDLNSWLQIEMILLPLLQACMYIYAWILILLSGSQTYLPSKASSRRVNMAQLRPIGENGTQGCKGERCATGWLSSLWLRLKCRSASHHYRFRAFGEALP